MVLQNLDIVKQFGISTGDLTVDIFIPEAARQFIRKTFEENNIAPHPTLTKGGQGKVVHIHPTSRWLFKCWKDEYMADVINWLLNKGIKVIVTSSPDKKELYKAKRILSLVSYQLPAISYQLIDLCGKTTIKQLAAISEAADVFLGVDSAPMHIAAAVGTPVIALWGPTGDAWKPWGKGHIVLSKDMECKPCKKGICNSLELRKCLEMITKEEVIEALSKMLQIPEKNKSENH